MVFALLFCAIGGDNYGDATTHIGCQRTNTDTPKSDYPLQPVFLAVATSQWSDGSACVRIWKAAYVLFLRLPSAFWPLEQTMRIRTLGPVGLQEPGLPPLIENRANVPAGVRVDGPRLVAHSFLDW